MREKHKKLRQGLAVMGMSSNTYWWSWFITASIINLIITTFIILAGYLFEFQFFTETPIVYTIFSLYLCLL